MKGGLVVATRHVSAHIKPQGGNTHPMYFKSSDNDVVVTSSNENLPSGTVNLKDLVDVLGALAFEDDIELDKASTSTFGVVKLNNATNDTTEESLAATTKAVGTVNESAVHKTGDETIAGTKTFSGGSIVVGSIEIAYDSAHNTLDIQAASSS